MKKVKAKWIPRKLSDIEKGKRIDICRQNLRKFKRKMNSIVTMDESWVHFYDPKTPKELQMWKNPNSPRPKAVKSARFVNKVVLIAFFDSRGMVYYHYLKKRSTVNGNHFIKSRRKAISRAQIRLNSQPLLLYDNAPCHRSREVNDFLTENGVQVVPHPPYTPDLAPSDFFLFPKLKKYLRGHIFASEKELKQTVSYYLNRIQETAFKNAFDNWIKRWTISSSI
jgi:histone-lysine N-methyltransferase SETMAR